MEFTRLSEATVVAEVADTANVLVEVDGEIKRVIKKEVGGAGGYVMTLTEGNCQAEMPQVVCTENYDEMYDVLMEGGSVWVDLTVLLRSTPSAPSALVAQAPSIAPEITTQGDMKGLISIWCMTDAGLVATIFMGEMLTIYFTNGSHNLTPTEEK